MKGSAFFIRVTTGCAAVGALGGAVTTFYHHVTHPRSDRRIVVRILDSTIEASGGAFLGAVIGALWFITIPFFLREFITKEKD